MASFMPNSFPEPFSLYPHREMIGIPVWKSRFLWAVTYVNNRINKGSSVFSGLCALIDDKLRHNIVKVAEEITTCRRVISTTNFDNVMVQFIIN